MNYFDPTPETHVILLLCAPLSSGGDRSNAPLTLSEYNKLAQWLRDAELRLGDLLHGEAYDRLAEARDAGIQPDRIRSLIERSTALAFVLDTWRNAGFWVVGRADELYPTRLREHLKRHAPALLFGIGNRDLLDCGGIAVVGSREVDDEALAFASQLGQACALDELQIISGGARGIDSSAAQGALEAGGTAIHVLPNGIERDARSSSYREFLRDGRLVLMSPYVPSARFSIGAAMGRNKVVYCLSDHAIVVASGTEGGTWQGAKENLGKDWVPLYVHNGSGAPEGNRRLLSAGALPLYRDAFATQKHVHALLENVVEVDASSIPAPREHAGDSQSGMSTAAQALTFGEPVPSSPEREMFDHVWPRIESALCTPRSASELAVSLGVRKAQVDDWIKLALDRQFVGLGKQGRSHVIKLRAIPEDTAQLALPLSSEQRSAAKAETPPADSNTALTPTQPALNDSFPSLPHAAHSPRVRVSGAVGCESG